jgi:hypothetical protein
MNPFTYVTRAFRRDPWTKVLAVVIACSVWYLTNVRERDAERIVDLPLVMRRVPRGVVVTEWPLDRVLVTLRGPGPLLDGIDERRSRIVVPLGGIEPGENQIDLKTARVEPELPGSLSVVRVQPGRITVVAVDLKKRSLPVRVVTTGTVSRGHRVVRVDVEPERVEVSGPTTDVERLEEVQTAPIHLEGARASFNARVFLDWVGDFVTFVPDRVAVRVNIEEITLTRKLDPVAVDVRGASRYRMEPPDVTLTVRAPTSALEHFALEPGAVYVDATGLAPGEHQVTATIDLPPTIEVVTRRPEVHRLVIEQGSGDE